MISQNDQHQVTKSYTLTVGRLIVNSPAFDLEGGNIKVTFMSVKMLQLKPDMKGTDGKSSNLKSLEIFTLQLKNNLTLTKLFQLQINSKYQVKLL
ncbi:hypothetical protein QK908_01355 [Lactococcus cremoris]